MLLGDLLDAVVRDESGHLLGHVIDARFVVDQPPAAPGGALAAARLHGLLVSPRRSGSFLGYERTDVRAPWLLATLLRRRYRGTFLIHWTDVLDVPDPQSPDRVESERAVVIRDGAVRYGPGLPPRG